MITHELAYVWITSDGKKFLDEKKARKYEKNLRRLNETKNKRLSSN